MLDAPAAGHAITFLQSARSLIDTVSVGPINAQARDVLELLEDHRQCQVVLVTIPEETPVNEAVETAFSLEDRVGIGLGPIVVNGVYPTSSRGSSPTSRRSRRRPAEPTCPAPRRGRALGGAAASGSTARRCRTSRWPRLRRQLPLPQLRLPFLFTAEIGPAELDELARAMLAEIEALPELPRDGPTTGGTRTRGSRGAARRPRRRAQHHRVLRLGRGGQDHHRRGGGARGRPPGRRTVVVTIDPAKRLADALGLQG